MPTPGNRNGKRGASSAIARKWATGIRTQQQTPSGGSGAAFVPSVRLDASRVKDLRGRHVGIVRGSASDGRTRAAARHEISEKLIKRPVKPYADEAGQPPLRKPLKVNLTKRRTIRGGAPIPAGAVGAALTIGRAVLGGLRGSKITGPTKLAHVSKQAAGASTTQRRAPVVRPPSRSRGGSARYQ